MKIVIFLAAVSAVNVFVGVEGIVPKPVVRMIQNGQIIEASVQGKRIEGFQFQGNVNALIADGTRGRMRPLLLAADDDRWVQRYLVANLTKGDIIHYWTNVKINGQDHFVFGQNFTVPAVGK